MGILKMKMTTEEIVDYCYSGMLQSVAAEQLLKVAEFYEKAEPSCKESNYDNGWEDGYLHAIGEMMGKLDVMREDVPRI